MNTQITADEIVGTVIKSEPWEEPVPLGGRASLPAFPVEVLPGYIAEMVNGTAEEIQVPADLPGALALAVLATVVAGRAEVAVRGSWTEPLNLFVAVAMPPGSGKSPAFRMMLGPISEAERQLQATARTQIAEAEAERKSALANAEEARRKAKSPDEIRTANQALQAAETMEIPIMPRLTADDTTPEQATTTLTEQGGRLAILSAEGAFFEIVLGRYSSRPNVELLLKGHAGDRLQIDRRSRTEAVDRPALTIGLCVQPQMLQDIAAKPQMQGRGALARFLFSVPRDLIGNRKIEPETVSRRVIEEYGTRLTRMALDLTRRSGPPAVIGLTAGALRLHTEWRGEIEPRLRIGNGDLETLREWAAKLPGATARLAGLLHLAQDPDGGFHTPIGEETMRRAIRLARYYIEHTSAAFGVMHAHPFQEDAQAVLAWIAERDPKEGPLTKRAVQRRFQRRLKSVDEVARVLALLEDHGYIRGVPDSFSVSGRTVYEMHPQIAMTR